MRKENYISRKNIEEKTRQWLRKLRKYCRQENNNFNILRSALIVIDMQNFFLNEKSHAFLTAGKVITQNIAKLINFYREKRRPVIFTYYAENEEESMIKKWWNDWVEKNSKDAEIIEELKPQKNETVLMKPTYSAFFKTNLEKILKENKIEQLLISGVMTHLCCETTARYAFVNGFESYFVIDATATLNEELHLSSLKTLAHGFSTMVTTQSICKEAEK